MQVVNEDTFECVIRLTASGHNPGDSWRSQQQGTQGESLCRRSNLVILLEKCKYPIPRYGLIYTKCNYK